MIATSYSNARQNFKDYCDKATEDNVVMLSEGEYNNLLENLYVRSDPKYYNELLESIDQLKRGKCQKRELKDE